jgi:hypothetical protein
MRTVLLRALFSAVILAMALAPGLGGLTDSAAASDSLVSVDVVVTVDTGDCDPRSPMDRSHGGGACVAQCLVELVETGGAASSSATALAQARELRPDPASVWPDAGIVLDPRPPARPV